MQLQEMKVRAEAAIGEMEKWKSSYQSLMDKTEKLIEENEEMVLRLEVAERINA